MSRVRHTNTGVCEKCEEILQGCHEVIRKWHRIIRMRFHDCHISSDGGYRDKAMQEVANARGTSKLKYPYSLHNNVDENKKPCSLAMDLFQQDDRGEGYWLMSYFMLIWIFLEDQGAPIEWGGNFTRPDGPHFQLDHSTRQGPYEDSQG